MYIFVIFSSAVSSFNLRWVYVIKLLRTIGGAQFSSSHHKVYYCCQAAEHLIKLNTVFIRILSSIDSGPLLPHSYISYEKEHKETWRKGRAEVQTLTHTACGFKAESCLFFLTSCSSPLFWLSRKSILNSHSKSLVKILLKYMQNNNLHVQ